MTRWIGPILLVMGILCATCAWAQNDTSSPDTSVPTQPGPQPAYTYPDATPSLDFLSQSVENSSISLGVSGGFSYDSNAYSNSSNSQHWWLFHVAPNIRIQAIRPKLSWNVGYSAGYQTYTSNSRVANTNNNLLAQQANGGFRWQLARRWQLHARDYYTYSANPFSNYVTTVGIPTMNNPNPVTYYPLTQYTQNTAVVGLTDQLNKTDTLSFTGTANLRSTSTYDVVTSVPFYNLTSYGGIAAYSHQFSPRLSLGASYNYNDLDFGHGQQRSQVQTMSLTTEYKIRPNMTITGFVGPQYTSTKTVLPFLTVLGQVVYVTSLDSLWSTSLGATFGWRGARNSARAGFFRSVTDGAGIIATSQANSINGTYRRMITRKMDGTLGAQYFHVVSTTVSSRYFDNLSFNASLTYRMMKSLTAIVQYSRLHQTQSNAILLGPSTYNANLLAVTVTYSWNHPLGR